VVATVGGALRALGGLGRGGGRVRRPPCGGPARCPPQPPKGTPWPPKKVGIREIPLHAGVAVAAVMAALFYDGPLILFIG
jgi:hypothetical protein